MGGDVVDRLLNAGDLFSFFVRDFAFEFFFEGHHQLDGVEGVSAQIIHERRFVLDFGFVYAKLFGNDFFDALFDISM